MWHKKFCTADEGGTFNKEWKILRKSKRNMTKILKQMI